MAASRAFPGPGRIDTHHHFFPSSVPELESEFSKLSQSEEGITIGLGAMKFPTSLQDHLDYMDEIGIQTAILTPSIQSDWQLKLQAEDFKDLCRRSLDSQLSVVKSNPLRFGSFALLPLPHMKETLEFIAEIKSNTALRPDGFGLSTSIGRHYLGDPMFEPLWEVLEDMGSTVFIHPTDSVMPPNLSWGPFVMEYPFDTCRCITQILSSGVLTRYPNIKFLFAHSGGAFPYLAGRIGKQHIDETIMKNNEGKDLRQLLQTANIFFDTAISSEFQYGLLQDIGLPKDHLIYATDYPYTYRQDTRTHLDGYEAPKQSGVFTTQELDTGLVRENALRHLLPRLSEEYAKLH